MAHGFRFRQLARRVPAARFDPAVFSASVGDLKKMLAHDAAVRHVPRFLADVGVRMVVVEHLPGSGIDGAASWLDENKPVVAVSMRFDRIDHFWFTLVHELAHIHHGDKESLDSDLVGEKAVNTSEKPEAERRADEWAANFLVKKEELEEFILRVRPMYSKNRINQFANRLKVHPGIIVGQLQRRKEILYSHSREMLVKVREAVTGAAMTDGWGVIAATGKSTKGG